MSLDAGNKIQRMDVQYEPCLGDHERRFYAVIQCPDVKIYAANTT